MDIDIIENLEKKKWTNTTGINNIFPGHSLDYSNFIKINSSLKSYLLILNSEKKVFFCPIQLSNYKGFKCLKNISGYTGFNNNLESEEINSLQKILFNKKVLTFYFINNPHIKDQIVTNNDYISFKNYAYVIDLNQNLDLIEKKFERNIKKNIILVDELKIKIKTVDKIDFNKFYYLYLQTCKRLNKKPENFYKKKALKYLVKYYNKKIIITAEINNDIVSTSIFIFENAYPDYLLNFSIANYNFCTGPIIKKAIELFKQLKIRNLNLGGGINNDDGLERFKKSFNSDAIKIYSHKIISNKILYDNFSLPYTNNFFPPFLNDQKLFK
jgi:hypothetical protein